MKRAVRNLSIIKRVIFIYRLLLSSDILCNLLSAHAFFCFVVLIYSTVSLIAVLLLIINTCKYIFKVMLKEIDWFIIFYFNIVEYWRAVKSKIVAWPTKRALLPTTLHTCAGNEWCFSSPRTHSMYDWFISVIAKFNVLL